MTIAQDWARERNWMKRQLVGMHKQLEVALTEASPTYFERVQLHRLYIELKRILQNWNGANRKSKSGYLEKRERR